jgi:hypothetical protein
MKEFVLTKWKWKPGMAVQRYGDWRKGEPQVIIDQNTWNKLGKPETVCLKID